MTKNSMIPRIRFKGFTDAWEQCKLGDVSEKTIEKNRERKYSETFTNSAELGIVSQMDYFDHAISKMESIGGYYVVRTDDFVYNPRISVSAPVGPINRNKLQKIGVMSPLYTIFRVHDVHPQYLEFYFKSYAWHAYMRFNGDSGARSDRFSIKTELFFDMPIPCPSLNEQEKIGMLLDRVDNLITLHQRKYEKFVNIKKALLEKMFPQGDEKVPRIRFKGFTDAWEQCKLGSIVYRASEMSETDDLPRVEYEDIDAGQGSLNKDLKEKVSTKKGIMFQSGDVLYGKLRPYLKNWLFAWFSGVAVGDFWVLRSNQVSQSFIYRLVQTPAFEYIANQSTGSKMPRADWNLVSNTTFAFPTSNEEQEAIGQIFLKLDNLITLHQRQVEKLKNIKSALLEKMFV